ncbi:MAG: chaperone modulator CbpM [Chitinophagaceae bacterium]
MQTEEMIPASEFCIHHHIELTFLYSLKESGLIEIVELQEKAFVPVRQLSDLEKLARLYYDMDINLEGIETISYLLKRIQDMQQQIIQLNNKLNSYHNE